MSAAVLPLRRSIFGRFTLVMIGVAFAATVALAFAADSAIREARDVALRGQVDAELAALADIHASGGERELIARVEDRLAMVPEGEGRSHYLVASASGVPIAGDLERWPALSATLSEAGYVEAGGKALFARATLLGPDLALVVAREHAAWEKLRDDVFRRLLLWSAAIFLGLALLGSWAALRLRRRVASINQAYAAVERGELERRAPGVDARDELGELAARANRMLDRIEALVAAQRSMTDHVAHELRTPLAHLDNRLVGLVGELPDARMRDELSGARAEIRGVVRMLEALLDISAAEARAGDRSGLAPVDLAAVTSNLVDLFEDTAGERGLRLETEIQPGVTIEGDEMLLSRMISNLLDNAFKLLPEGGTIRVRLAAGPRLAVEDDGPGVPPDMREKIFERFRRVPGVNGQGHGLGLALARAIALRHGLRIRVEDAAPGARFIIEPERAR